MHKNVESNPARTAFRDAEAGFTLLEVLVALLVAGLLLSAAARSLVTVLMTEETSAGFEKAVLAVSGLQCETYVADVTGTTAAASWDMLSRVQEDEATTNTWTVWTLSRKKGRGPGVSLAFHHRPPPEE
jgi:prepilin-type N-terminal cleavage/methylation domain-containing protein